MQIYWTTITTPVGEMTLAEANDKLCLCDWTPLDKDAKMKRRLTKELSQNVEMQNTPLLRECESQLNAYFNKQLQVFDLPLKLIGTDFQKAAWRELLTIAYGKTISYQTLATRIHRPKAIRAVGSAIGANAMSIIIPCHRIIGSDGGLGGYGGGLANKKSLLSLEGSWK